MILHIQLKIRPKKKNHAQMKLGCFLSNNVKLELGRFWRSKIVSNVWFCYPKISTVLNISSVYEERASFCSIWDTQIKEKACEILWSLKMRDGTGCFTPHSATHPHLGGLGQSYCNEDKNDSLHHHRISKFQACNSKAEKPSRICRAHLSLRTVQTQPYGFGTWTSCRWAEMLLS